jgi:hypothetical protein
MWLFGYDTETMLSDALPKCDSITAKTLAKQALEGGPAANIVKVSAYRIEDVEQVAYDGAPEKRTCRAKALLNSGKREILYTIEWVNKSERTVWLEIKPSVY